MSSDKTTQQFKFHYESRAQGRWKGGWRETQIKLTEVRSFADHTVYRVGSWLSTQQWYQAGEIVRIRNYVSYQVHDRIRYDNRPVTVWQAMPTTPGVYRDTRREVIAELLLGGRNYYVHSAHMANHPSQWSACTLHKESP